MILNGYTSNDTTLFAKICAKTTLFLVTPILISTPSDAEPDLRNSVTGRILS